MLCFSKKQNSAAAWRDGGADAFESESAIKIISALDQFLSFAYAFTFMINLLEQNDIIILLVGEMRSSSQILPFW